MRRHARERLETVALILGIVALVLALVLLRQSTAVKTDPVQVSRDFYTYHIIGGMEEDVGHIIAQEVNTNETP